MASLYTKTVITIVDTNGQEYEVFSKSKVLSSLTRVAPPVQIPVAAGGTATLMDFVTSGTTDNFTDFTALILWSSAASLTVEFTVNKGHATLERSFTIDMVADVPLQIYEDKSYDATYIVSPGGFTFQATGPNDVIDRIRVHNYGATTTTVSKLMVD